MDTQDPLKALASAGKASEVRDFLNRKSASAAAAYKEIREDASRTEEYRRHQLAAFYTRTRQAVDKELNEMASKVVHIDRDDAERVFGVKGLPGDAASLTISRRDAADRVAAITERSELRDLLRRATRSGDEVLARAIAERAVEMKDTDTMHQFIADRPDLDAAAERLWNANLRTNDLFGLTMHLAALRPSELSGMSRDAIEAMAAAEPATPSNSTPFAQAW